MILVTSSVLQEGDDSPLLGLVNVTVAKSTK